MKSETQCSKITVSDVRPKPVFILSLSIARADRHLCCYIVILIVFIYLFHPRLFHAKRSERQRGGSASPTAWPPQKGLGGKRPLNLSFPSRPLWARSSLFSHLSCISFSALQTCGGEVRHDAGGETRRNASREKWVSFDFIARRVLPYWETEAVSAAYPISAFRMLKPSAGGCNLRAPSVLTALKVSRRSFQIQVPDAALF